MSTRAVTPTVSASVAVRTPLQRPVLQRTCACGQHTASGGECGECSKKGQSLLRRATNQTKPSEVPPIVYEVLRSPGQPLDSAARAFFEPRFGYDFSHVRVHTDARAAQSAGVVHALAYTVGRDIAFGDGRYEPDTTNGRELLAHELTHAVQQGAGPVTVPLGLSTPDSASEREADNVAADIAVASPGLSRVAVPKIRCVGQALRRLIQRQTPKGTDKKPVPCGTTCRSLDSMRRSVDGICRLSGEDDSRCKTNRATLQDSEKRAADVGCKCITTETPTPVKGPAPKQAEKCEEFPGGSTDCEVDKTTGTPTGKVLHHIDEINACTKPCVEQHEAVHVKQLKVFCPQLRNCYLDADRGKRSPMDCASMAIFGMKNRECEAYKVSVPCMEKRLEKAEECKSKGNKEYGTRKLASERCFRDKNCENSLGK